MHRLAWLTFFLLAATAGAEETRRMVPPGAQQIVLVTTAGWTVARATLRRFTRANAGAEWLEVGTPMAALVGERGLAWGRGLETIPAGGQRRKQEGDRCAPAGVFAITGAFGLGARADLRLPYRRLTSATEAVDDPGSRFYNRLVERNEVAAPDWRSSERMATIPAYAVGLVLGHNPRNVPRAGSCVFIHAWLGDRQGTAGCTVLHPPDLATLVGWVEATRQPVLVQLPDTEIRDLEALGLSLPARRPR